jgi:hypothetical protein
VTYILRLYRQYQWASGRRALDTGIIRAVWLTPQEIRRDAARHRSPLVMRCIDDYLAGRRFPLDVLYHHSN